LKATYMVILMIVTNLRIVNEDTSLDKSIPLDFSEGVSKRKI